MYLSKLILNPSPAARGVQRDLASLYDLHRTVMRAFPDESHGGPGRVLFRLEPFRPGEPPVVLVQSEREPDWSPLEADPSYLLSTDAKPFDPVIAKGRRLCFRLRANPTVKRNGKRHGITRSEEQLQWLERKAEGAGFCPMDVTVRKSTRYVSVSKSIRSRQQQTHLGADYEGILEVTDPERFAATMASGIGPAKGYGFGLLSIAPLQG
jgi:CRISPR system Cascade subunit CasE